MCLTLLCLLSFAMGSWFGWKTLHYALDRYVGRPKVNDDSYRGNLHNYLAKLPIFWEPFTLSSLAFKSIIAWNSAASSPGRGIALVSLLEFSATYSFFRAKSAFMFALAFSYVVLVPVLVLGPDQLDTMSGLRKLVVVPTIFLIYLVSLIWFQMMATFFENLSCTYATGPGQAPFLTAFPDHACWTSEHEFRVPAVLAGEPSRAVFRLTSSH